MERPEIYTDNYNSLEEWIELRKRNEEFVYPQFFVPFREWMKDIEQKSDMEIKELLRILLQPYTLGVDTVDTYEFYKEYVQDKSFMYICIFMNHPIQDILIISKIFKERIPFRKAITL